MLPSSGPGGRRFKSSLPDQSFLAVKQHIWFFVYSGIGKIEAVKAAEFNRQVSPPIAGGAPHAHEQRECWEQRIACPYYKLRPTALGRKTWPFVSIRTHAAAIKSLNCLVDSSMHENKTKSGEPLGKSQWKGEGHFYAARRS